MYERSLSWFLAACCATVSSGLGALDPGPTVTVYDGAVADVAVVAKRLLSELDASAGVYHVNTTLWATEHSSFHVFATNRTEPCHYHPRDTVSTTISGRGAFRVPYSAPVPQGPGDLFIIPTGRTHAFGPVDDGPVLVSVEWSPPAGHWTANKTWQWASDVTIPASSEKCIFR
jgi:mannose-6-phosphate isomerase-like protein (cupin superfamily)